MNKASYPDPAFIRRNTVILDGEWDFAFDDATKKISNVEFDKKINVPFCYQSKMSGIDIQEDIPVVWYRKNFEYKKNVKRLLLCFGAVDYYSEIYINGFYAGSHIGGFSSFKIDITKYLKSGSNEIVVRCEDTLSTSHLRGKQSWKGGLFGCWYTPTTGIWQSVWLEEAGPVYVEECLITPDINKNRADFSIKLSDGNLNKVSASLYLKGEKIGSLDFKMTECEGSASFIFPDCDILRSDYQWSIENPNLIDVVINAGDDEVYLYFGMRNIEIRGKDIFLNNHRLYQKLVLDQGYWPDSLMTPPSGEDLEKDILLAMKMGFNGARKHQKIEDARYYYYADLHGFLVWGELPSRYCYSPHSSLSVISELDNYIRMKFNHPSIIAWVPLNESWGVSNILKDRRQQAFADSLACYAKSLDGTRFISSNDGWEQTSSADILSVHDYSVIPQWLGSSLEMASNGCADLRELYIDGSSYNGQPIILTEFGGIAFSDGRDDTWGYNGKVVDTSAFIERLRNLLDRVKKDKLLSGFCYTQLTDVMQETNGLLTPDRKPKLDLDVYCSIFK